jgi:CBS domain-containing protein
MNVLLLLTPKNKVTYIYDDFTIRQALEKMEFHRYGAMPIIDRLGRYVGTIAEGDLLWFIKERDLNLKSSENTIISSIPRNRDNIAVTINTNVEELIAKSINQNFIPVLDDKDSFIGIVTRRDIILYCYNKLKENNVK